VPSLTDGACSFRALSREGIVILSSESLGSHVRSTQDDTQSTAQSKFLHQARVRLTRPGILTLTPLREKIRQEH
jgi:hypothetical protein